MLWLLVDASHLAYRCKYAKEVGELSTSDGRLSGVVYAFLNGLHNAVKRSGAQPRNVIVVWDGGRSKRRMELLPEYKQSRRKENPTPEELMLQAAFYAQLEALQKGLVFLGTRSVKVQGTEADDIIALLSQSIVARSEQAVIYSGDKDLQQLASDSISILHSDGNLLKAADVCAKWGVQSPSEIVQLLALIGDSSDDIAGVKGVGPKRAAEVLPYWKHIFDSSPQLPTASDKVWKWVEVCRTYVDTIQRNIALIQLPRTWDESFYGIDAAITVANQLKDGISRDMPAFVAWCNEWELRDLHFSHW